MTNYGMPFFLEDRTGDFFNTEYDDLNDRLFYGVNCVVGGAGRAPGASTVRIFELGSRTSAHRFSTAYPGRSPAVMLDFGPRGELGTVLFVERAAALPMSNWMRKSMALGRYADLYNFFVCVFSFHLLMASRVFISGTL